MKHEEEMGKGRKSAYGFVVTAGILMPFFWYTLCKTGVVAEVVWPLYWIGVGLGLTWEIPMHFAGPDYHEEPMWRNLNKWPFHPLLQQINSAMWDGGLFIAGYLLVKLICSPPAFAEFRWSELVVLLIWGQLQEVVVEIFSGGAYWIFLPKKWNPVLFKLGKTNIALIPQLVWLYSPVLFYIIALNVK